MSDAFTKSILKGIIAEFAQKKGFSSISRSSLEILVDIAIYYLSQIAIEASNIASNGHRSDVNGLDIFFALDKFHENPNTLSNYINSISLSTYPIYIDPYPLPYVSLFYKNQEKAADTLPFRTNMVIAFSDSNSSAINSNNLSIPPFYPAHPERHTLDSHYEPESTYIESEAEKNRNRENEDRIKKNLSELASSKTRDTAQSISLTSDLVQFSETGILSQPTSLIEAPIYSLDGVRGDIDPEVIKPRVILDKDLLDDSSITRDVQTYLRILDIKHTHAEPGSIKNSLYPSEQVQENTQDSVSFE